MNTKRRMRSKRRESLHAIAPKLLSSIRRIPAVRLIRKQMKDLRQKIAADELLKKDFNYLIEKTGWQPDRLRFMLYWDSDMMHVEVRSVLKQFKAATWTIDRKIIQAVVRAAWPLAAKIEQINETKFSPVRSVVLRSPDGTLLRPREQRNFHVAFRHLPEIIRVYRAELNRKLLVSDRYWKQNLSSRKDLFDDARRQSLYERIRLAVPDHKYHANRLYRLVCASRDVRGLPPISLRAFTMWLNKLRKRTESNFAIDHKGIRDEVAPSAPPLNGSSD